MKIDMFKFNNDCRAYIKETSEEVKLLKQEKKYLEAARLLKSLYEFVNDLINMLDESIEYNRKICKK